MEYIKHYYIKQNKILDKSFQTEIVESIDNDKNGLIIMPTGTGKTIILVRILANLITFHPRVLILAPKIILIQQHFEKLIEFTKNIKIKLVLAESPHRLSFLNEKEVVVISTPHLISNEKQQIKNFFSLIFIDEVHNVHLSYPYADIRNMQSKKYGLTASLNSNKLKLVRYFLDNPSIYRYEQTESNLEVETIYVQFPKNLETVINEFKKKLKQYMGLVNIKYLTPKTVFALKKQYARYMVGIKCIKLSYLLSLLNTQPLCMAYKYLAKTKWDAMFLKKDAGRFANMFKIIDKNMIDPKMVAINRYLSTHEFKKCIIFTKFITTAQLLYNTLKYDDIFLLMGQNKTNSRFNQLDVVKNFKNSNKGILISTSVGYEGIDIPNTELILVYESTHTTIQFIQQRGRTARDGSKGKVVYFIYRYSIEDINYRYNLKKL